MARPFDGFLRDVQSALGRGPVSTDDVRSYAKKNGYDVSLNTMAAMLEARLGRFAKRREHGKSYWSCQAQPRAKTKAKAAGRAEPASPRSARAETQGRAELLEKLDEPLGIGVLGGSTEVMLEGGTALPAVRSGIYSTTTDGQKTIDVKILAGYRRTARLNRCLGKMRLYVSLRPAGSPVIQVVFDARRDGRLLVTFNDVDEGTSLTKTFDFREPPS